MINGELVVSRTTSGHANLSTTARYAEVNHDLVRREAERLLESRDRA